MSPIERAVFAYADAITYSDQDVSDELFAELSSFYNEAEIVTLTAIIAFENFRSKLNRALRVEAQGATDH